MLKDISVHNRYYMCFELYGKVFSWNGNKSFDKLIGCAGYLKDRNSFGFNRKQRIFAESRYYSSTRKFHYESSRYTTKMLNYFKFRCKKLSNYNTRRCV